MEVGFDMHQKKYLGILREISDNASYSDYKSLRGKLVWSTNTKRDIYCSVAKLAQVTEGTLESENIQQIKEINESFGHVKKSLYCSLL